MNRRRHHLMAALLLAGSAVTEAQSAQRYRTPVTEQEVPEDIVVVARRSGAPMWEVTSGQSTLLLVGEIDQVPKTSPWHPDSLEAATRHADRIILKAENKGTAGDFLRLILKGNSIAYLPKGTTSADYLDRNQLRRLERVEDELDEDYSRKSFLLVAHDILTKQLGFGRSTTSSATDVVRRAAQQARISTRPVGTLRGRVVLDDLLKAPPESHSPCLVAAMDAGEAGGASADERGQAWTEGDVPRVMSNSVEVALGRCWPWNSDNLGPELREQWQSALSEALSTPGVTLAVVPLRALAERGGLLDGFERQGASIKGPMWRRTRR